MRYLLILLLVLVLIALARSMRRSRSNQTREGSTSRRQAQDMVACEQCGIHLVRDDALPTRAGNYRCPEHPEQ